MSQTSWTEEEWAEFQARLKTPPEGANPAPSITHGRDCPKVPHIKTGYLHDENDDSPYDVDGCIYCGRCHMSIDKPADRLEAPIQLECLNILERDGWRTLITNPVSDRGKGRGFGEIGMADALAIRYGQRHGPYMEARIELLWLEFKRGKGGVLSSKQREWHTKERARGALTVIAGEDFQPSVESFRAWYRESGLQRHGI